ncbi:STAS domain-containing protein [Chitinibacter sp. SCUT-21]|uniref:STAS domain-containing protein n=1 Tax=Chitinibacter sp. SCUT-21 TaxID=2970891 RepID=UPI0035A7314B
MLKTITLDGEQTIYQAGETHQLFVQALKDSEQEIVVDLSHITEADSSLLQILIWLQHEGVRLNRPVQLLNPSHAIKDVIGLLGLHASFPADFGATS